jgi:hypothetical protein
LRFGISVPEIKPEIHLSYLGETTCTLPPGPPDNQAILQFSASDYSAVQHVPNWLYIGVAPENMYKFPIMLLIETSRYLCFLIPRCSVAVADVG